MFEAIWHNATCYTLWLGLRELGFKLFNTFWSFEREGRQTLRAETSAGESPGVIAKHFEQLYPFSNRGKEKLHRGHLVTIGKMLVGKASVDFFSLDHEGWPGYRPDPTRDLTHPENPGEAELTTITFIWTWKWQCINEHKVKLKWSHQSNEVENI